MSVQTLPRQNCEANGTPSQQAQTADQDQPPPVPEKVRRRSKSCGSHEQNMVEHDIQATVDSYHELLLKARKDRRAINAEGSEDGLSWISKVVARKTAPRELDEDELEELASQVQSQPPSFVRVLPLTPSTSANISSLRSSPKPLAHKDLPVPPRAPDVSDALSPPSQSLARIRSVEELADEARRRALAAEQRAIEQIRTAREMQKKLEFELSQVARRGREREEAEAAARVKWAREQVKRNALDAFARSKLEHEERQRRRRIEELKREEEIRAAEVKREKLLAERQERDAMEEARTRRQNWDLRQERLKEEEEKKSCAAEERKERLRRLSADRAELAQRLKVKLETDGALHFGLVRAQLGEGKPWKTRFVVVKSDSVLFYSKQPGPDLKDSTEQWPLSQMVGDDLASRTPQDAYEDCQAPHSCLLHFSDGAEDFVEVTIAFRNDAIRDEFTAGCGLGIEA